jgi:hypothetical protein
MTATDVTNAKHYRWAEAAEVGCNDKRQFAPAPGFCTATNLNLTRISS